MATLSNLKFLSGCWYVGREVCGTGSWRKSPSLQGLAAPGPHSPPPPAPSSRPPPGVVPGGCLSTLAVNIQWSYCHLPYPHSPYISGLLPYAPPLPTLLLHGHLLIPTVATHSVPLTTSTLPSITHLLLPNTYPIRHLRVPI